MTSNPTALCECGCGQPAPIAQFTAFGYVKGEPKKFIQGHTHGAPILPVTEATELDHAWAAGIIDGEGSIEITRSGGGHALRVSVSQSGEPLMLHRLQQLYGGRIAPSRTQQRSRAGDARVYRRRPLHVWTIVSRGAEAFLRSMEPHSVQKVDQIRLAIAYRETAIGKGKFDEAQRFRLLLQEAKR